MSSGRLDALLFRTTMVAVVAASAVVVWATFHKAASDVPAYRFGDVFSAPFGLRTDVAPATLILWVDSRCRFCTDSMPFYRSLLASQRTTRIVVMGAEPREVLEAYAKQHNLEADETVSAPDLARRLGATPILLLVSRDMRVLGFWKGKLPDGGKEELEIKSRL